MIAYRMEKAKIIISILYIAMGFGVKPRIESIILWTLWSKISHPHRLWCVELAYTVPCCLKSKTNKQSDVLCIMYPMIFNGWQWWSSHSNYHIAQHYRSSRATSLSNYILVIAKIDIEQSWHIHAVIVPIIVTNWCVETQNNSYQHHNKTILRKWRCVIIIKI